MRDHAHTLSDFRVPTLSIECEPCGRRGRYNVARLMEKYGNAKLPELRPPRAGRRSSATSAPQPRGEGCAEKMENNPMHLPMHQASRCHARSKRSGLQCRSPASRMHGARGGAPNGNRNALKHGDFTAETLALKRQISALARMARETMGAIE